MPVHAMLSEMAANNKKLSDKQVVERLSKEIPRKCLACYATGANYSYAETAVAQQRRQTWFENASKKEAVKVLHDAIQKAGEERCRKDESGDWTCEFKPGVKPRYFRLFDSGDFNSVRDVEIWYELAKKNPDVKFWAPTTAYAACATTPEDIKKRDELVKKLKKLNKLKNVAVRPSGLELDKAAPKVSGFASGATVTSSDTGKKQKKQNEALQKQYVEVQPTAEDPSEIILRKKAKGYGVKAQWEQIDGKKHWICPGDCSLCRKCWDKKTPVAYVLHGRKPHKENILDIVKTVQGGRAAGKEGKLERWKEVDRLIAQRLLSNASMGPDANKRAKRD